MLVQSGKVALLVASDHVFAASKNNSGSAGVINLVFLFVIIGAVVLFMRRGRQRQRAAMEARGNVAPGVEVVTTAGMIGTVVDGDDETVTLEIAPGVQSRFLRQAIARVVVPPGPDEPPVDEAPTELPDHPDDAPPGQRPA